MLQTLYQLAITTLSFGVLSLGMCIYLILQNKKLKEEVTQHKDDVLSRISNTTQELTTQFSQAQTKTDTDIQEFQKTVHSSLVKLNQAANGRSQKLLQVIESNHDTCEQLFKASEEFSLSLIRNTHQQLSDSHKALGQSLKNLITDHTQSVKQNISSSQSNLSQLLSSSNDTIRSEANTHRLALVDCLEAIKADIDQTGSRAEEKLEQLKNEQQIKAEKLLSELSTGNDVLVNALNESQKALNDRIFLLGQKSENDAKVLQSAVIDQTSALNQTIEKNQQNLSDKFGEQAKALASQSVRIIPVSTERASGKPAGLSESSH
ncbi:hypothetical protein [Parendozoicomonas haliclonae]|uniref:Uncharacterized protein n=1 Tax=Parendozoicomonas haliclonae TaxID=1960125 RepID=A0A1X7AGC1_9GAMM|nr:hypothetical protein [Parendozoicomonas haliclonae]SMA39423.1 hypothetical protein EHSB41UT_01034 [Parendozoicomonas haliclonae]